MLRRHVLPAIATIAAATFFVAGCSKSEDAAAATSTSTAPATVTVTASATETSPTTSSTTASTDSSESSSASPNNSIRSVKVELEYGMKVANDTYQLSKFGDVELPTVRWAARSEDGDNKSNECGVIVDFTGPGGYDERNRSDECTGFVNGLPRAKTAGDFLITVTLTPPGGGKPIVTKRPIKVIPYGS